MMRKIISMILILCLVSGLLSALASCSEGDLFIKGVKTEENILTDKTYSVGSVKKTGWELKVGENTFDDEQKLAMTVLSAEDAKAYQSEAFDFIGTPVIIKVGNENSIRLNQPVTVTMRIPNNLRVSAENADDYLVGYYTGKSWEYLFPDFTAVSKGYITFETYHFSLFGTVKLTDTEKIKLYAEKMALQTWEDEQREQALTEKLQEMFNESFEKMGIQDESVRGKLFNAIAKERDFGTLVVAAEQGDLADFSVKCGEMAANALIRHMSLEDAFMDNITGKGAAVATGLLKGGTELAKGNYEDAAKEIASAFIGYFPAGRAFQATVEVTKAGIESWKDYELNAAYKTYVGLTENGQYGYKVSPGDWSALEQQMRGYLNRLQSEAKDRYCAVNGISRSELDKDERLCRKIEDEVSVTLKAMFERRRAGEQEITKKEAEYRKIIEGFEESGLLKRGSFGFDGMDVQDRLRTLFSVRRNILGLFGGKMPVRSAGETEEGNLNQAIAMWLSFGTKNRGEFYKWLIEKGYKSEVKLTGEQTAAWVLSGANPDQQENPLTEAIVKNDANVTAHSYDIHPGGGSLSETVRWMDGNEYTISASYAFEIPESIKPGESFEIKLKASDNGTNNRDAFVQHWIEVGLWVRSGENWSELGRDSVATGVFVLNQNPSTEVLNGEKTVRFTAPAQADGFTVVFFIGGSACHGKIGIHYDYEYNESGS